MCFEIKVNIVSVPKMDMKKHDQVYWILTVNVQSLLIMYQQLFFGSDISAVTAKDLLVLGININIKVLFKAFWYDACEWRTSLLQRLLKIHEEMSDTYTCTMYYNV